MTHKVTPPLASPETFQDARLKRPPSPQDDSHVDDTQANDIQVHPRTLGSLFAKRPLILGEDEAAYDTLMSTFTGALKPANIIEELLVKDIVDLTWNIERFERLKDSLLLVASKSVLTRVLQNAKCPETERPLDAEHRDYRKFRVGPLR